MASPSIAEKTVPAWAQALPLGLVFAVFFIVPLLQGLRLAGWSRPGIVDLDFEAVAHGRPCVVCHPRQLRVTEPHEDATVRVEQTHQEIEL